MIVVSEIGEQWSPHTAPAIQAAIEMIMSCGSLPWNTSTTIGISIPNVPHDVPEANARPHPIANMIAGSRLMNVPATDSVAVDTNVASPRLSVIALSVHASVRIRIGATIALKPSGMQSMLSLNPSTPLAT